MDSGSGDLPSKTVEKPEGVDDPGGGSLTTMRFRPGERVTQIKDQDYTGFLVE